MKKQQVQQAISSVRPTDFLDLPYSPSLLLDSRLGSAMTDVPAFSEGCQKGFDGYLECISELGDDVQVRSEVRRFMVELATEKTGPSWIHRCSWFHWNIGYGIGWLSALALCQYQEAKDGLKMLTDLVECFEDR